MKILKSRGAALSGSAAGIINGLFGAGGGMVLVPLLSYTTELEDKEIFPASVAIILPVCLISLSITWHSGSPDWHTTIPYLLGSALGGIIAGILSKHISATWLHRLLGILILWGGIRYLC